MADTVDALVEKLAEQLEREWGSWAGGPAPALESYVDWLPEDRREQVLRRLLPIDREHRRRRGEPATLGAYLARFPALAGVVRVAFGLQEEAAEPTGETVDLADLDEDKSTSYALRDAGAVRPSSLADDVQDRLPDRGRAPGSLARPRRPSAGGFTPIAWDPHADDPPTWWKLLRLQLWLTGACLLMLGVHLITQFTLYKEMGSLERISRYEYMNPYQAQREIEKREESLVDHQLWYQGTANIFMGLVGLNVLGYLGLGGHFGWAAVRKALGDAEGPDVPAERRERWWPVSAPPQRLRPLAYVIAGYVGILIVELSVMGLCRLADVAMLVGLANLVYFGTLAVGAAYWVGVSVPLLLLSAHLTAPAERRWLVGLLSGIGAAVGIGPVLPVFVPPL